MKNRITIQSLRNLDLNSLNEVLADIYRELNRIADSADEISFRTTRDGNKELLINDGQKEYRDNTKLSRFGLNLSSEKIKAKDLAKDYVGVKYYNYIERSNLHKFFSNEEDENTIVDIVTALKSSILRFNTGNLPRWKIGFDTEDVSGGTNIFKINAGSGTTLDDPSEFELDSSGNLVLTGTLTSSNGVCSGTGAIDTGSSDITTTGTISFGSLRDIGESITITKFVDAAYTIAANNNDTTIPTSAAVKAYTDAATQALVDDAPGALNTLN